MNIKQLLAFIAEGIDCASAFDLDVSSYKVEGNQILIVDDSGTEFRVTIAKYPE